MFPECNNQFIFPECVKRVIYPAEYAIIFSRFFIGHQIREIIHLQMFLVAPPDDLMGPYEEHTTQEGRIRFECRCVGEFFIDLELRFGLLLLHLINLY